MFDLNGARIWIAGHRGMVGSAADLTTSLLESRKIGSPRGYAANPTWGIFSFMETKNDAESAGRVQKSVIIFQARPLA